MLRVRTCHGQYRTRVRKVNLNSMKHQSMLTNRSFDFIPLLTEQENRESVMRNHYSFNDGQVLHDIGTVLTSAAVTAVLND